MDINAYSAATDLLTAGELEKVKYLAFYYHKREGKIEFTKEDISKWFNERHLSQPNMSRLAKKILESGYFIKGTSKGAYKLHALVLDELQSEYPGIQSDSEEIISDDTILPNSLYKETRGFIESLSKQINASYEYNIYDGAAVLMRRLLEILLILTYEHLGKESEILDTNNNYLPLEKIINNAKSDKLLKLSRDSKNTLDEFRELGNFSAHKVYYNCRRNDFKECRKILQSNN